MRVRIRLSAECRFRYARYGTWGHGLHLDGQIGVVASHDEHCWPGAHPEYPEHRFVVRFTPTIPCTCDGYTNGEPCQFRGLIPHSTAGECFAATELEAVR